MLNHRDLRGIKKLPFRLYHEYKIRVLSQTRNSTQFRNIFDHFLSTQYYHHNQGCKEIFRQKFHRYQILLPLLKVCEY